MTLSYLIAMVINCDRSMVSSLNVNSTCFKCHNIPPTVTS